MAPVGAKTIRLGGKEHQEKFTFLKDYLGKRGRIENGNNSDAMRWIIDLAFAVCKREVEMEATEETLTHLGT